MAHITGGGLTENIPRILPRNCKACIRLGSWPVLPIFGLLQKLGKVGDFEMLRTFNMGVGMVIIVSPKDMPKVALHFRRRKEGLYLIGEIRSGKSRVVYE